MPDTFDKTSLKRSTKHGSGEELVFSLANSFPLRARVRALWGLSGWRGNERIANSIKRVLSEREREEATVSGSDRAPNFRGPPAGSGIPFEAGAVGITMASLPVRPRSSAYLFDHCCRMGADCRELDGPLRPTARLSAIGSFARSTRARQANRFAERPEFATGTRETGARLKLCQAQAVGRFPAESYSLPILSFPLQPLRPHNARTRARAEHIQVQRFHHCGPD